MGTYGGIERWAGVWPRWRGEVVVAGSPEEVGGGSGGVGGSGGGWGGRKVRGGCGSV